MTATEIVKVLVNYPIPEALKIFYRQEFNMFLLVYASLVIICFLLIELGIKIKDQLVNIEDKKETNRKIMIPVACYLVSITTMVLVAVDVVVIAYQT